MLKNIHAKLVVKTCFVLSCPAFVWMPFAFLNAVKKTVTKYNKMNCLEPVYITIHFAQKCQ